MKKIIYSIFLLSVLSVNYVNATMSLGLSKVDTTLKGSTDSADIAAQKLITNVMFFLGLIAVAYALWGGFLILTAGGKEDNVKKGRTVIIQALLGLVVIFLAYSIVQWLITAILGVTA